MTRNEHRLRVHGHEGLYEVSSCGEGVMQKLLAEMYGVSEPTISRIINVRGVA